MVISLIVICVVLNRYFLEYVVNTFVISSECKDVNLQISNVIQIGVPCFVQHNWEN